MARPRKTEPTHTSLVASAVRLPIVADKAVVRSEAWQDSAWLYYDSCAELRFTANWVGNMMSRAELTVIKEDGQTDTALYEGPEYEALQAYFNGQQGQSEMLRLTGLHLTVAGECYHVYRSSDATWHVLAAGKVRQDGKGESAKITLDFGDSKQTAVAEDIVIRVWNPHPKDPMLADSPVRANLDTLAEIDRCNKHVQATLVSRLAGAGILFVPQDITFPVPEGMDPSASSADVFMSVLGEAMMTPIETPGTAAAVVPIVVQAPGDSLDQIKHITFWSDVSDSVREMRDSAVKRLALGMDIPPEVLLGMADSNHWNAWLVDESSVKAHTEPRLAVVANAITTAYLRPAIDTADKDKFGVVGDTSNIRLRPNRSAEAVELYDRGELSPEALLRETGFEVEDAPDDDQFRAWLLRKIALGSTSPEQTQAALEALGVAVPVQDLGPAKERPSNIDNRRTPVPAERQIPTAAASDTLVAACDVLVYRALERAGNKIKSATNFTGPIPASDIYLSVAAAPRSIDTLMNDAWSCLPQVLASHDVDPAVVTPVLDSYVRGLIANQVPHRFDTLRQVLAAAS